MRLKRETFRHIEAEIRCYHDTLKQMEELRRDIMLSGSADLRDRLASGDFEHSGVERRAVILADSILLREMERITTAIRQCYGRASDVCRLVLWARYDLAIDWCPPKEIVVQFEGGPNRFTMQVSDLAAMIGMAEPTFHRNRTWFVYQVSEALGWY